MEDPAMDELLTLLAEAEGPLDAWEQLDESVRDWRDAGLAVRVGTEERDSENSSSDSPKRSRPQKRRTRKQELSSLREQVARLSEELSKLKLAAGIDVETPVARVPSGQSNALALAASGGARPSGPSLQLWKKIAAGQLERRVTSEAENRALRIAVSTHIRRAKRLRQTLIKRAVDEHRLLTRVVKRPASSVLTQLPDDELVYRKLAEGMDAAYASIDNTFRKVEMHKVPRPGRLIAGEASISNDGVMVRQVHIVPFPFKDALIAVWAYYTGHFDYQENQVTKSMRFPYTLSFGTVTMQQRSVARRYKESDRIVIINRALTEPMDGIKSCTSVQLVVKPGKMSPSGPTTAIEIFMTGTGTATPEARARTEKLFKDWQNAGANREHPALHLWEKALDKMMDTIDNLLVTYVVSRSNTD